MEEQWVLDRAKLRTLLKTYPNWTLRQYMRATGRSRKWVQKWRQRLQASDPDDQQVLLSRSRARKKPHQPYHPQVIRRILELRDHPPPEVPRKLGASTILYYLQRDPELKQQSFRLPQSTSTIWKILNQYQRIHRPIKIIHHPFQRPDPMDTWEIDFTDVNSATSSDTDKQQHEVEAFAVVDRGTSILVDLQASDDYHARTTLIAMASTLIQQGCPRRIVFDRDPRFIGSWSADGFPSAFMRFLLSLGIATEVCPPQRPDLKPFVERYFRVLQEECVNIEHPEDAQAASRIFDEHRDVYNHQRPSQAKVCGNRPPSEAFPILPRLSHIPEEVDPDHWLMAYHNRLFKRRVRSSGSVQIDKDSYYVGKQLGGRYVVLKLDAQRCVFDVMLRHQLIKTIPIKGLFNGSCRFGEYLGMMLDQAESAWRRLQRQRPFRAS